MSDKITIAKVSDKHKLVFVRLTKDEALSMIRSLANQILHNDPNHDRAEYVWDKYEFSVAVMPEKENDK